MKRSTVLKAVMKSSLEAMGKPTASDKAVSQRSMVEGVVEKGPGPELPEGGG